MGEDVKTLDESGERVAITHRNTYYVRAELRELGGVWDAGRRTWMVPADRAGEARNLVESFETGEDLQGSGWEEDFACFHD